MRIYCMSDIHGCLEPFLKALETVDMESEDSMLVLLGDSGTTDVIPSQSPTYPVHTMPNPSIKLE